MIFTLLTTMKAKKDKSQKQKNEILAFFLNFKYWLPQDPSWVNLNLKYYFQQVKKNVNNKTKRETGRGVRVLKLSTLTSFSFPPLCSEKTQIRLGCATTAQRLFSSRGGNFSAHSLAFLIFTGECKKGGRVWELCVCATEE